jgi:Immunoglobulin I-set domain
VPIAVEEQIKAAENAEVEASEKTETDKPLLRESTIVEEFKEPEEKSIIKEETSVKKKKKLIGKTAVSVKEAADTVTTVVEETLLKTESVTESKEVTREMKVEEDKEDIVEEEVLEYSEEELAGPLPLFEVKPEPATAKEGEAVKLLFKLAEEPPAEVSWAKNGKKLKKSKKDKRINFGVDETTGCNFLEIAESAMEDSGEYTLTAENEGGIVACTVSVNIVSKVVKSPPRVEEFPKPQTVKEGGTVELVCKVTGKFDLIFCHLFSV